MPLLTDKDPANNLQLGDLVHIVDVSDTSSNPLGSSKKASIQQLLTFIQSTVDTFLELTDSPNDYTGQAEKAIRVNLAENGLEFFDVVSSVEPTAITYTYNGNDQVNTQTITTAQGTILTTYNYLGDGRINNYVVDTYGEVKTFTPTYTPATSNKITAITIT